MKVTLFPLGRTHDMIRSDNTDAPQPGVHVFMLSILRGQSVSPGGQRGIRQQVTLMPESMPMLTERLNSYFNICNKIRRAQFNALQLNGQGLFLAAMPPNCVKLFWEH
jgi:hypothetical protein